MTAADSTSSNRRPLVSATRRAALGSAIAGAWLVAFAGVCLSPADAQDWPQWRGPDRDGVAAGAKLPDRWPAKLRSVWNVEVGAGYSAPAVSGGVVVVMARQEEREIVLCLDAKNGRELWRRGYDASYKPEAVAAKHGKGPFATPTIEGGRVYTCGISNVLSCFDLESGKIIWRKHFSRQFKKPHPMWGASNSPLIEGGLCILGVGTEGDGGLAGLDKNTGDIVWKLAADGPGYSSPIAVDVAGQRQVIVLTQSKLVGAVARSGALLWEVPYDVPYEQNALTPVLHENTVVVSGYKLGALAIRIEGKDGKVRAEQAWANAKAPMYMSTPVVRGRHLYGLSQRSRGSLVCIDLANGRAVWSSPGGWGEYVSIILAGDRLLVLTTRGELVLIAADPRAFKELDRTRVTDRPVWAHAALAGNRLYVKDATHVACLELP